MPTAVMTLSMLKTMSMRTIWVMTGAEGRALAGGFLDAPGVLDLVADLPRGLADEEEAPGEEDEVLARDAEADGCVSGGLELLGRGVGLGDERDLEERGREAHEPGDGEEEGDAGDHREEQADAAGGFTLRFGKGVGEDGDEDDVVDAEDDLEAGERDEGDEACHGKE